MGFQRAIFFSAISSSFLLSPLLHAQGLTQGKAAASADLALSKTVSTANPLTGQSLTYTLTVTNRGPGTAKTVQVTDDLPAGLLFTSCTAPGGTCGGSGQHRTASFPSLAPGRTATVRLTATVSCALRGGTFLLNSARASSAMPDPVAANSTGWASIRTVNPPPALSRMLANPAVLQAPDHQMRDVLVLYAANDNCDPSPLLRCELSVASNEPAAGTGAGDLSPDWKVLDEHHLLLRAEVAAGGKGRIYTITATCRDVLGAAAVRTVKVMVPNS